MSINAPLFGVRGKLGRWEGITPGGSLMKLLSATLVLLIAGSVLVGSAIADPAAPRGHALVNACAACHGPDGRSQGSIPSFDNLPADDFMAALKAFRTDARLGTVMNLIAKALDDAEISAMAAYFATRRTR
jgi:cytochrome subunit of sulfide dehydrogenase